MSKAEGELWELFIHLRECPSWNNRFPGEMPRQTWDCFLIHGWPKDQELTVPAMAALVLYDQTFAQLLTEAERSQLLALAQKAMDKFRQETCPPQQLGMTIAGNLEES